MNGVNTKNVRFEAYLYTGIYCRCGRNELREYPRKVSRRIRRKMLGEAGASVGERGGSGAAIGRQFAILRWRSTAKRA